MNVGFLVNSENATPNIAAARPFIVAAHVRHGDKGIEMPLVPLDNYMHAAERLLVDAEARGGEGEKRHPIVFISTEDPDVIIRSKTHWAAAAVSPATGWRRSVSHIIAAYTASRVAASGGRAKRSTEVPIVESG